MGESPPTHSGARACFRVQPDGEPQRRRGGAPTLGLSARRRARDGKDGSGLAEGATSKPASCRDVLPTDGLHSNIGQRLSAVRAYVEYEDIFLANYSDGLSNAPLDLMIDNFVEKNVIASFIAVRTSQSFHSAQFDGDGIVSSLGELREKDFWINGGFFVLRQEIFDDIGDGEELVVEPFSRLIDKNKLAAYPYNGYWRSMDTFKDKISFDRSYAQGDVPWENLPARLVPASGNKMPLPSQSESCTRLPAIDSARKMYRT